MEPVLEVIFSFSEGYNFRNRQVCSQFRQMIPKVEDVVYIDCVCRDSKPALKYNRELLYKALTFGCINIFRCASAVPSDVCKHAAFHGQMEILQWAHEKEFYWNEDTCELAARGGHLEILKWCREQGCRWDEETCFMAAHFRHLDVLEWALDNGCPCDERVCMYAARGGHLDVLIWCIERGYTPDDRTFEAALKEDHLEIADWLFTRGYRTDPGDTCYYFFLSCLTWTGLV
ncbi:Ankyrin repeat-containing protein [Cedratvirus Zaza IHUMI]|uniref:Ankyrin repeat-containing protein n=1 Tax=Cedratvirus Zaza IHUMI TaxID=2126979 RepID=A0A2R8FF51_9VIRU|nr:Ankyrin repeat-containing protein [Cedratvirus Zaza IHUMI]